MLSGEEIVENLEAFVTRWSGYSGSEVSEAQSFLNELLIAYGTDRRAVGAVFEDPQKTGTSTGFIDMHWPGKCIVEMKRPSVAKNLALHRSQALRYWTNSADIATEREAPRWLVLCAFETFEVWEPGKYPNAPRLTFALEDLAERYESLLFLAGEEAYFRSSRADLTTEATRSMVQLFESLRDRDAADPAILREFILQLVWTLFAESLGMLPKDPLSQLVRGLLKDSSRSSAAELGQLFEALNEKDHRRKGGIYAGAPYANGGLFRYPARVHLEHPELELLSEATSYDWRQVDPTIFGSLMEGCLGQGHRWELGAHYTHESDILRIVRPTIVAPWAARIESLATPQDGEALLVELAAFTVLDPACGCGNFLYVAYRELRRLEHDLKLRIDDLYRAAGASRPDFDRPGYPLANLHGLEIDEFAVLITRVTLWMGHKLAADEFGLVEPVLPLRDLSNVRQADALRVDWPSVEVIIGNPPFHGTKRMRRALGDDYVDWLRDQYKVGVKDYCVYWFRKTHEQLRPGQRAGLVGTNSIAEGKNREASLDHIVTHGGVITDAVRNQKWPGTANVYVSIVNWIKRPDVGPEVCTLDARPVDEINSSLRAGPQRPGPEPLVANQGRQFFGVVPSGDGFILTASEAADLIADPTVDYRAVVRPYLIGDDITQVPGSSPSRWIIDFREMPLERAMGYPKALEVVRARVKPARDKHKMKREREQWWRFSRSVDALFRTVAPLDRYIACAATSRTVAMVWCQPHWVPGNSTCVLALADDYSLGVLSSSIHATWAIRVSTHLKMDHRYTIASFATFPWPEATADQRDAIGRLSAEIETKRRAHCIDLEIGLTTFYDQLAEGAYGDVASLHRALDEQVCDAYGWPTSCATNADELEARLYVLNQDIARGTLPYDPSFPALPEVPTGAPLQFEF